MATHSSGDAEPRISATIISFNEEHNIERCLKSLQWVDEIVVVDSFSMDRTVEIASRFTNRVIQHAWEGHIAQKNFAVGQAAHDWILSLDADEEVSADLRKEIEALRKSGFAHDGYRMPRRVYYLGRWIAHSGWYPDRKLRLFDRRKARWGGRNPHDRVILDGSCADLSADLFHYTYFDVRAHIEQMNVFTTIAAEELYKEGRKSGLGALLARPFFKFLKCYLLQRGFLDGRAGVVIAVIGSFGVFLKYLKLWEMQRNVDLTGAP